MKTVFPKNTFTNLPQSKRKEVTMVLRWEELTEERIMGASFQGFFQVSLDIDFWSCRGQDLQRFP